jgi:hypothetical protein
MTTLFWAIPVSSLGFKLSQASKDLTAAVRMTEKEQR